MVDIDHQNYIRRRMQEMSKLLVVVDMQNDFITGSLGTKEAEQIVPNVVNKIETYRAEGNEIVYTRDTHMENYLETREGSNLPVVHCVKGTWGWELQGDIENTRREADRVFDKGTFGSTALGEYVAEKFKKDSELEVELVGLCTDICVISNAFLIKAFCPEIKIGVDAKCCAGVSVASHENALMAMKMCQVEIRD